MFKIALIGQTNVGKSTLFNALIEQKKAIVSQIPMTTRDRNYGTCLWQGKTLTIIDTGGIEPLLHASPSSLSKGEGEQSTLSHEVKKHIQFAINEADLIFFITEIRPITKSEKSVTGIPISNFEREISRLIQQTNKPTLLVLNKADNPEKRSWAKTERWKALRFGMPFAISAANGSGIGDLLDKTIKFLQVLPARQTSDKHRAQSAQDKKPIKVAIIGRPNVGKSTLLNALLGEEKAIVSPLPHTTRGPQDTLLEARLPKGESYALLLIDTAGIRRRTKIKTEIEKMGVKKSLDMIEQSHIVLFMLDITEPISHQDKSLIRLIIKHKKGLIMVVNKCDLISKPKLENLIQSKELQKLLPLASWAPFLFISAKKRININMIFSSIYKTNQNYNRWIETKKLNQFLLVCIREKKFDADVWERISIYQQKIHPPTFILKIPKATIRKRLTHTAQLNIIEKELRKTWNFTGTPIVVNNQ